MIDVAIIGTGVCGAAVARELSKYRDLQIVCLERIRTWPTGLPKQTVGSCMRDTTPSREL